MEECKISSSDNETKCGDGQAQEKASPIAAEDILIVTELAQIGHKHLSDILPDIRKVVEQGGSALTEEHLKHFESIVKEGNDTIVHFSNMCQYLEDAAKELHDLKK